MKQLYLIIYQSLSSGKTGDLEVDGSELSGKIKDVKAGDNKILNIMDIQTLRNIKVIS